MLAIARALAARPAPVMIDELSLGLAPIVVEPLLPAVRDVARDTGSASCSSSNTSRRARGRRPGLRHGPRPHRQVRLRRRAGRRPAGNRRQLLRGAAQLNGGNDPDGRNVAAANSHWNPRPCCQARPCASDGATTHLPSGIDRSGPDQFPYGFDRRGHGGDRRTQRVGIGFDPLGTGDVHARRRSSRSRSPSSSASQRAGLRLSLRPSDDRAVRCRRSPDGSARCGGCPAGIHLVEQVGTEHRSVDHDASPPS